jgi:hypothetical protein
MGNGEMTYLSISAFVETRHQKEYGSDSGSNMAMGMATAAQVLLFHSINGTQSPQNTVFLHECDCPTARHDTLLPSCWLAAARHQDLEARSKE